MATRGRFVCHVHCLVHDGVVRSSPCRPHHENFGRNLYHMFVPAYSASLLCFVFICAIRVASKSNVDSILFPKWCSHIPMWILILLDNQDCHVNPVQLVCFLFKRIRSFSTSAKSIISSSQCCSFHPSPSCFCFSRPPSLLSFKDSEFLITYHVIDVKPLHFFPSMLLSGDSQKDTKGSFKFIFLRSLFFLWWFQFKPCRSYPFLVSNVFLMPVYLLIVHLSLSICSGVLKISRKIRVVIPNLFKISRGCYLFWAI